MYNTCKNINIVEMISLQISFLFLRFILQFRNGNTIDISQCISPLGMESSIIADSDITASSSFDSSNVGPQHGRLKQERNGGAWCPKQQITSESHEWLEINLHSVHMITGTCTQGRFGNGQGVEYAEAYMIEYWRPKLNKWVRYRSSSGEEVIQGNTNTYLESKYELEPAIWASKIRFLPYSYHRRTVCMRVEIYGCLYNDGILSYSMAQGDKRGNWEFFDASYDGYWDGELRRGLGQLIDGKIGPEDFKIGYRYDRDLGWVGWKNDTRAGHPLDIKFEFDTVREFSAIHIYCNNQFTKDVQVFSEVKILFSIGGKLFNNDPIIYTYMEDKIFETPRNVSIKLHHRIGKFVKLRFTFAAKWLMLSEITFDSDIAHGNFTPELSSSTEYPELKNITKDTPTKSKMPIPTSKQDEPSYMAIIIGVLTAVILLLAVAIFFIITHHKQRKNFGNSINLKNSITGSNKHHLSPESPYDITDKKDLTLKTTYQIEKYDDRYSGTKLITLPRELNDHLLCDVRLDQYQEPFNSNKYNEPSQVTYYGYSTVVVDSKDLYDNVDCSDSTYDYATPIPIPSTSSEHESAFSEISRGSAKACLQSFFPPPPPPPPAPTDDPPSRASKHLLHSGSLNLPHSDYSRNRHQMLTHNRYA